MTTQSQDLRSPLHHFDRLGKHLGIELLVQRDDLLPFPLAGNKVRKISAELGSLSESPDVLITNGGIDSNHCRTVAMTAAYLGLECHLVLHGTEREANTSRALPLLRSLGAKTTIVESSDIRSTIESIKASEERNAVIHTIPGGCHSPAGARAYAVAGRDVIDQVRPDYIFLASGTGATHGGLAAAASDSPARPIVIGASVARASNRGHAAVAEAAAWAGAENIEIHFDDRFRAGGYGRADQGTYEAVSLGWNYGLPLDPTYTGKAFAALLAYSRRGELDGARILFWHTGGLWNHLASLNSWPTAPNHEGGELA